VLLPFGKGILKEIYQVLHKMMERIGNKGIGFLPF
jgi:prolyl-tRNA synthetase